MQQPSQHQHHHLFSAIGSFLNVLQPSSSNPNPNPDPATASVPSHGARGYLLLYQDFESHLAQRLSSLFPTETPSLTLSSLTQFLDLIASTQTDLRTLIISPHQPRIMEEFLVRSIKLLDICRDIKEQITEMESVQGMLHLVLLSLSCNQGKVMQIGRARKPLLQLLLHMGVEREDETPHVHLHRSFRARIRERLARHAAHEGSPPQRRWSWSNNHAASSSSSSSPGHASHVGTHASWHSTHGNHATHPSTAVPVNVGPHASEPSMTLHDLELTLIPPNLPPRDDEECFEAAIYALHVVSVFFLGVITTALPCISKTHILGPIHPPLSLVWASPFIVLQENIHEELSGRTKKHGSMHASIWELDQITSIVKRLFELVSVDEFPRPNDVKEELKKLVERLGQHVAVLERGLSGLYGRISECYNRIISARMGVLYSLSTTNA